MGKVCEKCEKPQTDDKLLLCPDCLRPFEESDALRAGLTKEQLEAVANHILRSWKFQLPVVLGIVALALSVGALFDYFADRKVKHFFVPVKDIRDNKYDLSISRYRETEYEEAQYDPPKDILRRLRRLDDEVRQDMDELEELLK